MFILCLTAVLAWKKASVPTVGTCSHIWSIYQNLLSQDSCPGTGIYVRRLPMSFARKSFWFGYHRSSRLVTLFWSAYISQDSISNQYVVDYIYTVNPGMSLDQLNPLNPETWLMQQTPLIVALDHLAFWFGPPENWWETIPKLGGMQTSWARIGQTTGPQVLSFQYWILVHLLQPLLTTASLFRQTAQPKAGTMSPRPSPCCRHPRSCRSTGTWPALRAKLCIWFLLQSKMNRIDQLAGIIWEHCLRLQPSNWEEIAHLLKSKNMTRSGKNLLWTEVEGAHWFAFILCVHHWSQHVLHHIYFAIYNQYSIHAYTDTVYNIYTVHRKPDVVLPEAKLNTAKVQYGMHGSVPKPIKSVTFRMHATPSSLCWTALWLAWSSPFPALSEVCLVLSAVSLPSVPLSPSSCLSRICPLSFPFASFFFLVLPTSCIISSGRFIGIKFIWCCWQTLHHYESRIYWPAPEISKCSRVHLLTYQCLSKPVKFVSRPSHLNRNQTLRTGWTCCSFPFSLW